MPSDVFWAAVVAGGAGLASNVPTYLVTRSGHSVQRAAMAAENERLSEQHRRETDREGAGFQRETLIELQDWLVRLARVTALIYQQHELEYRRTGAWGRERLGGSLSVEFHEAIRNVRRYSVRVRDDEVRREAKELVELAGVIVDDGGDEDGEVARGDAVQALKTAYALNDVLNDHIGQRLRELF